MPSSIRVEGSGTGGVLGPLMGITVPSDKSKESPEIGAPVVASVAVKVRPGSKLKLNVPDAGSP